MSDWPTADDGQAPDEGRRGRFIEDIFILLCVLSLWPVILGWQHVVYEVLLYGALFGLVVILIRRARRFSQARREVEE